MGKNFNYDYIIIGSGPAGRTAAHALAKGKKRTAVIEANEFGGADLNTRNLPYSISLNFAHAYSRLSTFPALVNRDLHFNFPSIVSHMEETIATMRESSLAELLRAKVDYIEGSAHFLDQNTVAVGSDEYTAENFILATGAHLKTKEIAGLDSVNYLTPDTALKLRRLPECVFIVGGGSTGCEIASYFAELGVKVIIAERAHRLLPREDKEVSETIASYLTNELGVTVVTNSKVVAIEQDDLSKRVIFNSAGQEKLVRVDCIVLATGSTPTTDYGLENAGVKYKNSGIVADKSFQTTAKNIFAIGDTTGTKESSTERAEYEGTLLVQNLLHKSAKAPANYHGFIRRVNTYLEVATVGFNEYDLLSSDHRFKKSIVKFDSLPVSYVDDLKYGFVKILVDSNTKILGATIVAPHASLMMEELALAVRHHLTAISIASTPHISNSYDYAIKLAAKKLVKTN